MAKAAHHRGGNSATGGVSITAFGTRYVHGHHDLPCLSESLDEALGIDPLNAGAFFQRAVSGQGGTLAEDHKWRFHTNRGKTYMAGRNAERHQKILAFFRTWGKNFIADRI